MSHKIRLTLDDKSITLAVKDLEKYNKWVKLKTQELSKKLAEIGENEARIRFASSYFYSFSFNGDVRTNYQDPVDVRVSKRKTQHGYKITANGHDVCFVEFGTGVAYNTPDLYPTRPQGVVGIGQYGKGQGKKRTWRYGKRMTHGIKAQMPMYYASKEMRAKLTEIAREVFND